MTSWTEDFISGAFCAPTGFKEYRIGRRQKVGAGHFQYAVARMEEEGVPALLQLSGASGEMDPLKDIQRVDLKVDPTSGAIMGIISNDECVVRKDDK